jgi:hypothetical protein
MLVGMTQFGFREVRGFLNNLEWEERKKEREREEEREEGEERDLFIRTRTHG